MLPFRVFLFFLISLISNYNSLAADFNFSASKIWIISNGDKKSVSIADYFYSHLYKRNLNKNKFTIVRSDDIRAYDGFSKVYFELVEDLKFDYEIINEDDRLSIFAKDKAVFTWISYMLIDKLSEHHEVEVSDLFPNYLEFNTKQVNFAFQYRDPHLLPNTQQELSSLLCTHNVDRDWGIWGHHLNRVLGPNIKSKSLALINGKRDSDQYCFSSVETFQSIKDYIIDNHGVSRRNPMWFMIAPNDNDKVCQCSTCVSVGNTVNYSSPAIALLLNRLASEFRDDFFYTTGYRTSKVPPNEQLAKNTGVFLSTIDLSKSLFLNSQDSSFQRFDSDVKAWKKVTDEVYLWDYISNFDEYFVPYPMLYRVQEQFIRFRNLGVAGLFLNGSGYDYSPFDDVKTYVLSALLIDPYLSIPDLISKFYHRFYPNTATLMINYLLRLEQSVLGNNVNLDIYSSFRQLKSSYFNTDFFLQFYQDLSGQKEYLEGTERENVEKLLLSLSYVKLQIAYYGYLLDTDLKKSSNVDTLCNILSEYRRFGLENYKEDQGKISEYLEEWNSLRLYQIPENRIKQVEVRGADSGVLLADSDLLYDNILGFTSDFNQGWFLSGEDININCQFETDNTEYLNIQMRFLKNSKHRMLVPSKIELFYQGKLIREINEGDFINHDKYALWNDRFKVSKEKFLEIRIYKSRVIHKAVIGNDEILLY